MTKFNEWWQTKSADFHEDADAWSVGQGWRAREPEIESLRQQLDAAEANCQCELIKLEQQLAESQKQYKIYYDAWVKQEKRINAAERSLVESQAREKVLRGYLTPEQIKFGNVPPEDDPAAFDSAIRQAKREALLEAINEWEKPYGLTDGSPFIKRLHRMADNLKD